MNIIKEQRDDLNAVIKIQLKPEDYKEQVEKTLRDHQKKVSMPGFRPGKVPVGLVKKMYGKNVLVDEINKILSDSIYKFITDNKLDVLGNPLPNVETMQEVDWENPSEFEFSYDLAFAPQFDLKLDGMKMPYYSIRVDETLVDKYIKDIRQRHGKFSNPEVSGEKDMLFGEFQELGPDGQPLENGIKKHSSILIETVKSEELKSRLKGISKDADIDMDPKEISGNAGDLGAMLGIDTKQAEELNSRFRFHVMSVSSIVPADLNQELFDNLYGAGKVNSEEEFRAMVKQELEENFQRQADSRLRFDVVNKLTEDLKLTLPDEFLKRWLKTVNDKPITDDQLEKEYPSYADSTKKQLIENKLIKDNDIKVTQEEALELVKELLGKQFAKYNQEPESDDQISEMAKNILKKKEEADRIYEMLYDKKIVELLKSKLSLEFKDVSEEEFFNRK